MFQMSLLYLSCRHGMGFGSLQWSLPEVQFSCGAGRRKCCLIVCKRALGGEGREGVHFPALFEYFLPSLSKLTGREGIYKDDVLLWLFLGIMWWGWFSSCWKGLSKPQNRSASGVAKNWRTPKDRHWWMRLVTKRVASPSLCNQLSFCYLLCWVLWSAVYIAQNNP